MASLLVACRFGLVATCDANFDCGLPIQSPFRWRTGAHGYLRPHECHLIPSTGFSTVHECDRRTDHTTVTSVAIAGFQRRCMIV